jgi:4'-phosphopantetheinyl transferase
LLPADNDVDVWTVPFDDETVNQAALSAVLSADERARAARYHFERHRSQFVITRGAVRSILAHYTGLPPHALQFCYSAHGKPALGPGHGAGDLYFSVSHTEGRAVCGVARGRAVGVDVERVRHDVAFEDIAERFFAPNERSTLSSLPADERVLAFFRCWTRKEAYVKALGGGLSVPFDAFDVTLGPAEPVELRPIRRPHATEERWSLAEIMSGPDYVAAVAAEGQGVRILRREWAACACR